MKFHPQSHEPFRVRLLARAGLLESLQPAKKLFTAAVMAEVRKKKWSPSFEAAMRDRLLMGCLRYETPAIALRCGFKGRPYLIETEDMIRRIRLFQKDGNLEHLADVANFCMIQWEVTDHPKKHFDPDRGDRHDTDWMEVKP